MHPYEEDDKVSMEQEQPYADGASFKSSMFDSVTAFEVLMVDEFSDLNLVIGSHIIAVHQLVLASHSQLLAGGGAFKISFFVCDWASPGMLGECLECEAAMKTSSVQFLDKVYVKFHPMLTSRIENFL